MLMNKRQRVRNAESAGGVIFVIRHEPFSLLGQSLPFYPIVAERVDNFLNLILRKNKNAQRLISLFPYL